ncbi:MAG: molybdenum cofactor biosynthesis protein MoaE [Phyllobacteriaceae bacterium]|nr:molybdenum cofactor biosynthesis protein MoaE [Phyllobacteriaceae bacterium]
MVPGVPPRLEVRVQHTPIDVAAEMALLNAAGSGAGAMASFTGFCRSEGGQLAALELEHYPGMAERQISAIAGAARQRFGLSGLVAVHRHGLVRPCEVIVFVAALARHRDAAFDGARFVMDYLKTDAPFWKKEHRVDGTTGWVSAKDADDSAKGRWTLQA